MTTDPHKASATIADTDRSHPSGLTHVDASGAATMVDVGDKLETTRTARAEAFVHMRPETLARVTEGTAAKGDVLATARIAGIMAAKRTHELIPLCHPLAITKAAVELAPTTDPPGIHVTAMVRVTGKTGVEMEALTAASIAALTIYDMLKAAEKGMVIADLRLVEKTGGKSGDFQRDAEPTP